MARRPSSPKIDVKPGDWALIGNPRLEPWHWFIVRVLLVDGDEVATIHSPPSGGEPQRQFLMLSEVRAVADSYGALTVFQGEAARAVKPLSDAVTEAGRALEAARNALFKALDDAGMAQPRRLAKTEAA